MSKDPIKPRGLGRGLAALLGDDERAPDLDPAATPEIAAAPITVPVAPTTTLPIEWLKPGKYQPRYDFNPQRIAQLAESIAAHGLIQPILVRPVRDAGGAPIPQSYEIVAGERRWRAAQQAKLYEVPVVVRPMEDRDALEIALIENIQRADLNALEEAAAYSRLQSEFGHTQERIGATVGKSRAHVANTLRLLDLPPDVAVMIGDHRLEAGQARALLGTKNPVALAHYIIDEQLSTREVERLTNLAKEAAKIGWDGKGLPPGWSVSGKKAPGRAASTSKQASAKSAAVKDADTLALERTLTESLGVRVEVVTLGPGEESRITIHLDQFDQMDMVVQRLTRR